MRGKPEDPDRPPPQPERLLPDTDQIRIDFLNAELELCFTFASLVDSRLRTGEREGAERSLADAEKGYATTLRFLSDPKHADHIGEKDRRDLTQRTKRLRSILDGLRQRLLGEGGGESAAQKSAGSRTDVHLL